MNDPLLSELQKDVLDSDYTKLNSNIEGLDIYVKDIGTKRKVNISGRHVVPFGSYNCEQSDLETELSVETLSKIASKKGRHFRDEIERSENPKYMLNVLKILLREFNIAINGKTVLDFGCGAGAFTLNLLRLGPRYVIGVDVEGELLDIAAARVQDFFNDGCQFVRIDFIDGENRLPFDDNSFDIVWPHAVMEHVFPSQRHYVLRELWRVVKVNGLMILDATPNRLWIKEAHTSNLLFLNYLPINIATALARRFSKSVPANQPKQTLLSRGFRGCTYWEIKKPLLSAVCINNEVRKSDLSVWMKSWLKDEDSRFKRTAKEIYGLVMRLVDPILGLVGWPQSTFLPYHILVFKKQ